MRDKNWKMQTCGTCEFRTPTENNEPGPCRKAIPSVFTMPVQQRKLVGGVLQDVMAWTIQSAYRSTANTTPACAEFEEAREGTLQ